MDINAILNGLMNITSWIEDVLINGLLGQGFAMLVNNGGIIMAIINFFILLFPLGQI